jgi:hypothetical protein
VPGIYLAPAIVSRLRLFDYRIRYKILPLSQIVMLSVTAISAILTLFLSVWCLMMSLHPRRWRLWWMSSLRQIDVNSTSEERRHQDGIFRGFVSVAFVLSILVCGWTFYWTWTQWIETRQARAATIQLNESANLRKEPLTKPSTKQEPAKPGN